MSEIRANTVSNAAGTGPATLTGQYAAKAWVNFNGTGTVAIRESGNVASITDGGTGVYTVNLATAMVDANYAYVGSAGRAAGIGTTIVDGTDVVPTTSAFGIQTRLNSDNNVLDAAFVYVTVTR